MFAFLRIIKEFTNKLEITKNIRSHKFIEPNENLNEVGDVLFFFFFTTD